MNDSLDRKIQEICSGIRIEQVEPQSESTLAQRKKLIDSVKQSNQWIDLYDNPAQFRFFGWLSESEDIVGMASLIKSSIEGTYGLSYIVHPDFRRRGVATAVATHAVESAKTDEKVKTIYAHVRPNTPSEKIVKNLGFGLIGPPIEGSENLTYLLRVK